MDILIPKAKFTPTSLERKKLAWYSKDQQSVPTLIPGLLSESYQLKKLFPERLEWIKRAENS